jgi:hypothetical protein
VPQSTHALAPGWLWKLPAAQPTHSVAVWLATSCAVPAGHGWHTALAVAVQPADMNVPIAHASHLTHTRVVVGVQAEPCRKKPAAHDATHGVHASSLPAQSLYVPAGHGAHSRSVVADGARVWNWPAGHVVRFAQGGGRTMPRVQVPFMYCWPARHAAAATHDRHTRSVDAVHPCAVNWLSAHTPRHGTQMSATDWLENVPVGHGAHCRSAVAVGACDVAVPETHADTGRHGCGEHGTARYSTPTLHALML